MWQESVEITTHFPITLKLRLSVINVKLISDQIITFFGQIIRFFGQNFSFWPNYYIFCSDY